MRMTWEDLLFMHWSVSPSALQSLLPEGLVLDTFEGHAYVGVVPFVMSGVRPHLAPPLPGVSRFAELNVRTYVTCRGTPGVWFFSLDATSKLAVRAARAAFHLPYYDADIRVAHDGDEVRYTCKRVQARAAPAQLDVRYAPTGPAFHSADGTLERFLTDRLTLYAADDDGAILRGDIQHAPWPLQPARAEVIDCHMTEQIGVRLPDEHPIVHFAKRMDVLAWWRIHVWPPAAHARP